LLKLTELGEHIFSLFIELVGIFAVTLHLLHFPLGRPPSSCIATSAQQQEAQLLLS